MVSVTTFCTFVREFSPLGARVGRIEEGNRPRGACATSFLVGAAVQPSIHVTEATQAVQITFDVTLTRQYLHCLLSVGRQLSICSG